MSKNNPERAARLAEALRANLRKRKAPKADTPLAQAPNPAPPTPDSDA